MYPKRIAQYTRLTIKEVYEDGTSQLVACQLPVSIVVTLEDHQGTIVPKVKLDLGPHWDPDVELEIEELPGNLIVTYPPGDPLVVTYPHTNLQEKPDDHHWRVVED